MSNELTKVALSLRDRKRDAVATPDPPLHAKRQSGANRALALPLAEREGYLEGRRFLALLDATSVLPIANS
jgi:hypothetical protein